MGLFSKITRQKTVNKKFASNDPFAYLYVLFPITVAFLLTFGGARLLSHIAPWLYIHFVPGLHVHHVAYGTLILAASGYLALISDAPKYKYLTALLHGFGLGLAFDEFGILLRLSDDSTARWSYDGLLILTAIFFLIISTRSGVEFFRIYTTKKGPIESPEIELKRHDLGGPNGGLTL